MTRKKKKEKKIYFLKALGMALFIFIILIKIIYSSWLCGS